MRRRLLPSIAVVVVATACLAYWLAPGQLAFIYHCGTLAITSDETLTVRLYYKYPWGRWVRAELVSLVGDLDAPLEVVGSVGQSRVSFWPVRYIDAQVRVRGQGGTVTGAIVQVGGTRRLLPLGKVVIQAIGPGEVLGRSCALERVFVVAPHGLEVSVNPSLPPGTSVNAVYPADASMGRVTAGDWTVSWVIQLNERYAGVPVCAVYRPLTLVTGGGMADGVYSGPLLQILAGISLPRSGMTHLTAP